MLLILPAASATSAHASLAAERVGLEDGRIDGSLVLVGFLGNSEEKLQSFAAEAQGVEVVMYREDGYVTPVIGVTTEAPARQEPVSFEGASLRSLRVGDDTYLTGLPAMASSVASAGFDVNHQDLVGLAEAAFAVRPASPLPDVVPPPEHEPQPAIVIGQPVIEAVASGAIALRGDIVLRLYDVDFEIVDHAGNVATFETGLTVMAGLAAQESRRQWADVTMRGADLVFRAGTDQAAVFLATADLSQATSIWLEGATGALTLDGAEQALEGERVTLSGPSLTASFAPGPPFGDGNRLIDSTLAGQVDEVTVDGAPAIVSRSPPVVLDGALRTTLLVMAAALVLVVAIGLAWRRFSASSEVLVMRAEEALEAGKARRAVALARRALPKAPSDPDALTILAIGLLRLGRDHEAVAVASKAMHVVASEHQPLMRVLLATARLRTGDEARATEELALVAREHPEMALHPTIVELLAKSPKRGRRTASDSASYS